MKWLTWIRNLRARLRIQRARGQLDQLRLRYQDQPAMKPNRKQCEELLQLLNTEVYKDYQPRYSKIINLSSDTISLDAFTKKITDTSAMILRDVAIPNGWIRPDEVPIAFDKLFVGHDGFYLNAGESVIKFKKSALRLCELLQDSDSATHGLFEHNFRMLSRLFVQLRELTIQLIEVSQDHQ